MGLEFLFTALQAVSPIYLKLWRHLHFCNLVVKYSVIQAADTTAVLYNRTDLDLPGNKISALKNFIFSSTCMRESSELCA